MNRDFSIAEKNEKNNIACDLALLELNNAFEVV